MELRIVQLHNTDRELGTEGIDPEDTGALELWHDGQRVLELVWFPGGYAPVTFVATYDRGKAVVNAHGLGS